MHWIKNLYTGFDYSSYAYCYKRVQSFRVQCLFTGQYYTEEYITLTDVK